MIQCRVCGTEVAPSDRFCPECGSDVTGSPSPSIAPAAAQCKNCGSAIPPGVRFCRICGTAQDAVSGSTVELATSSGTPWLPQEEPRYQPEPAAPLTPVPPSPSIAHQSWSGSATVAAGPPTVVFSPQTRQHSFVVRAIWYLFVGWWLSGIVITIGYLCTLTVIGIPLGFYFFNRIPQVVTLRGRTTAFRTEYRDGVAYVTETNNPQYPWYMRGLWFIFIGWWLGAVWLASAWLIGLLIITLPITFWMYNRTSGVMTLQRH